MVIGDKKEFNEMVDLLRNHFHPSKMYLFGSRAKGTSRDDSDYDLLLVIPSSDQTIIHRMQEAYNVLWGKVWLSADIFIYTEKEFDERKELFNSVAEAAFTEGVELNVAG